MKQILFFRPQDFTDFHVKKGATHPDSERTLMVTFYLEENVAIVGLDSSVDKSKLEEILFNEESKDVFIVKGSGGDFFVSKNGVMDFNLHNGWILNEKIEIEFSEPETTNGFPDQHTPQFNNDVKSISIDNTLENENPQQFNEITETQFSEPLSIKNLPNEPTLVNNPKINMKSNKSNNKASNNPKPKNVSSINWLLGFIIFFIFIFSAVIASLKSESNSIGLEPFVIFLIFLIQCVVFYKSSRNIDDLNNLFQTESDTVEMNSGILMIKPSYNHTYSHTHLKIIDRLNKYLKNNAGASNDYGILKQIVELEVNSSNEKAQSLISFPLYLGLAGTFLGIILGLSSFSSQLKVESPSDKSVKVDSSKLSETTKTSQDIPSLNKAKTQESSDDDKATIAVNKLLGGVSIAMIGSFFGLALTFACQWNYANAQSKNESDFNAYLGFIQVELLPKAQSDADQAYRTLAQNLSSFNTGLEKNLLKLENTLAGMDNKFISVLEEAKEATAREIELVNSIKEIDLKQVASIANKNISLANIQNEYISQIQDTRKALVELNNNSTSVAIMLTKFKDFYDAQFEQTESLKVVESFVNHLGLITEKLEELTGSRNAHFQSMLDKMYKTVDDADVQTERYLKGRMEVLAKLFTNTNIQFEQYVSPGEARTTFENINQLPAAVESLTKSTNELRQQLPQLVARFTEAEKAFREREMKQSLHMDQTLNEVIKLGVTLKQTANNLDPVIQVIMKAAEPTFFDKINPFKRNKNG